MTGGYSKNNQLDVYILNTVSRSSHVSRYRLLNKAKR